MGWEIYSNTSRSELIERLIRKQENDYHIMEILKHHVDGDVLWTLVKKTIKKASEYHNMPVGSTVVFISCELIRGNGSEWLLKSMDERMSPAYYSCPLDYLDEAPEIKPQWRQQVRHYHERLNDQS